MDNYITGAAIRRQRERRNMTQLELARLLDVSDKTISKWETAKGLPDITLIEPLARALNVSVMELLSGNCVTNRNISCNMLRSKLHVCPVCGNIILSSGEAVTSCCGITLPALEAEEADDDHRIRWEEMDGEYYLTLSHEMTKTHHISFLAYVTSGRFEVIKLYAEGEAAARLAPRGHGILYCYCNKHGLMQQKF